MLPSFKQRELYEKIIEWRFYYMKFVLFIILSFCFKSYALFFVENYENLGRVSKKSNIEVRNLIKLSNIYNSLSSGIGTNYALSKTAYASSTNDGNTPDEVLDGIKGSGGWDSKHGEEGASSYQWIVIDLGEIKKFNLIKIYWETAYAKRYSVQVSSNGTNWVGVYSNNQGSGGTEEIHFSWQNARYIKINCYERVNDTWGYHIYEIEIYKKWYNNVYASSTNNSTALPWRILDGNLWAGWDALHGENGGSEDQWICIDFGEPKEFNLIKIYWENAYAKAYKIQVSDDGQNWTTILFVPSSDGGIDELNLPVQNKRYVRIYCYERVNDTWGYHIYEVEFYKTSYFNNGYLINKNITPLYLNSWKNLKIYAEIPAGCSASVDLLKSENGISYLPSPINLNSGLNSINLSSLVTDSTLSIKFNLNSDSNGYFSPIIYSYSINWSVSTNYIKLNSLRLIGQFTKVNENNTFQVSGAILKWQNTNISSVEGYEIYRANNLITDESIIQNSMYKIGSVDNNISNYTDVTITDIGKEYYYVICVIDTNGFRELSNNIKLLAYSVLEREGFIYIPADWLWREGEDWDNKDGGGIDYKSSASEGVCLGAGWSGWAEYNIDLENPMNDAYIYLRYALWGSASVDIYVDNVKIVSYRELINTGNWNVFTFSYFHLGYLSSGKHTIKIDPSWNINLDGFFIYDGYFIPENSLSEGKIISPLPWRERKILISQLNYNELNQLQKSDILHNPMIKNPTFITAYKYYIENIEKAYFKNNIPVNIYLNSAEIPAGLNLNKLSIFYWDGNHWIKIDTKIERDGDNYILTSYVNRFGIYSVFESNNFDKTKKAFWTYNPFSPNNDGVCDKTVLQFYLERNSSVRVRIFDISGNLVKTLLDGKQFVGNETISVEWDGTDDYNQPLKSGVYIYQIESDGIDEKVINGTIVIVR